MRLEKRKPSGREKDEASIRLLAQLREKLYSEHIGTARRAAFNLSWMQEDGLDILKEALFSSAARRTKSAAAYGLRKMRGRMEKIALEVLSQGLQHFDSSTAKVCENALLVLKSRATEGLSSKIKIKAGQPASGKAGKLAATGKFEIKHVPQKSKLKKGQQKVGRGKNHFPK